MLRMALRGHVLKQGVGVMVAVLALGLGTGCGKKGGGGAAPASSGEKSPENKPPPPSGGGGGAAKGADPSTERFADQAADNQIDVPKDWGHAPQGDALLITSPDKKVFIELSASLAMGKDKADEPKLIARLEKSLQNVKRTSPITKAAQNGLSGWKFGGNATKGGKPYDWESFALEDPKGKGAFGLVYASTADLAAHRAVIDKILSSVSSITH
jgi:hypothetical protein